MNCEMAAWGRVRVELAVVFLFEVYAPGYIHAHTCNTHSSAQLTAWRRVIRINVCSGPAAVQFCSQGMHKKCACAI